MVFRASRDELRFVAALCVFAAAAWLLFRDEVLGAALVDVRTATAEVAVALIRAVGMEAVRDGTTIYHPAGFGVEISRGCTPVIGATLLAVATLAYPVERRRRLVGVVIAVPLFVALNFVRLVHLFYLGVHEPGRFALAHETLWQGGVAVAIYGLWLAWKLWADRATARGGE
ncbi:MAG: archaeosortase/exosortase family protein [Gemmatimonadales bacterium]